MARHQVGHGADRADAARPDRMLAQRRGEAFDHAGHQRQPADALARDDLDQRRRVVAVDHDHRVAPQQAPERMVGRGHVEERRPGDERLARAEAELGDEHQSARDERAVADRGALGQTGRAAGVEDHQRILRLGDRRRLAGIGARQARLVVVAERDRERHRHVQPGEHPGVVLGDQHGARLGEADAVHQLGRGEPPVLRRDDRAELGRGQLQLEPGGAVAGEHADPIAAPDARGREHVRQTVHALVQRGESDPPLPSISATSAASMRARAANRPPIVVPPACRHHGSGRKISGFASAMACASAFWRPVRIVRRLAPRDNGASPASREAIGLKQVTDAAAACAWVPTSAGRGLADDRAGLTSAKAPG